MNSDLPVPETRATPNGGAMAAIVAAGAGACLLGIIVVLHEAGVFSAPAVYAPAGGISGRTSFAVGAWLIVWLVLHLLWSHREIPLRRAWLITMALTAVGVLGTFPPFWKIL